VKNYRLKWSIDPEKSHNKSKSSDDIYVLAQICMNASPSNRSRELLIERIMPQLGYNNDALRKTLVADATRCLAAPWPTK
jgi:hypothetical protein